MALTAAFTLSSLIDITLDGLSVIGFVGQEESINTRKDGDSDDGGQIKGRTVSKMNGKDKVDWGEKGNRGGRRGSVRRIITGGCAAATFLLSLSRTASNYVNYRGGRWSILGSE
jgi:hypothetical protein